MSTDNEVVTVTLLNRSYRLQCEPDEQQMVIESANYLDRELNSVQQQSKASSPERVAVMVALNVVSKLLEAEKKLASIPSSSRSLANVSKKELQSLEKQIDKALRTYA